MSTEAAGGLRTGRANATSRLAPALRRAAAAIGPVATVVLVILVLWYGAAVALNAFFNGTGGNSVEDARRAASMADH